MIERRGFIGAALAALTAPLSLFRREHVCFGDGTGVALPPFDASTKPLSHGGRIGFWTINFMLTEDLDGPWAKAMVTRCDGYPFSRGEVIHAWNPAISMAAWAGKGTFAGKKGQAGVAVLSNSIRQPTYNQRAMLPMIVAMADAELEPCGMNWRVKKA
jgi:hypothetical protein